MKPTWFKPDFADGFWSGVIPMDLSGTVGQSKKSLVLADFMGDADWKMMVNGKPRVVKLWLKVYIPLPKDEVDLQVGLSEGFKKLW